MWESSSLEEDFQRSSMDVGSRTSAKFLKGFVDLLVTNALAEDSIPIHIIAQWSLKRKRLNSQIISSSHKIDCSSVVCKNECCFCGLSMQKRRVMRLTLESDRRLLACCKGCEASHMCGQLPECSTDQPNSTREESSLDDSSCLDSTYHSELAQPIAFSTPLPKKINQTLQKPLLERKKKFAKRGSALEKMLKDEESISDNSLSGFLNNFGLQ